MTDSVLPEGSYRNLPLLLVPGGVVRQQHPQLVQPRLRTAPPFHLPCHGIATHRLLEALGLDHVLSHPLCVHAWLPWRGHNGPWDLIHLNRFFFFSESSNFPARLRENPSATMSASILAPLSLFRSISIFILPTSLAHLLTVRCVGHCMDDVISETRAPSIGGPSELPTLLPS